MADPPSPPPQHSPAEPPARHCPDCDSPMQLRSRSAMRRCGGLLIVYAALLLLVIWAPGLDSLRLAIVVGLGALGAALACRRKRWRCPQCGRELMDVPPEGG